MKSPLSGRLALVTGGTRGIGAAIARRLSQAGAEVVATGRSAKGAAPKGCRYAGVDFTNEAATAAFADEAGKAGYAILVNNAGLNVVSRFAEIGDADYDLVQRVNVRAPMQLCRAVLPGMRRKRWGRIVNVGSVFGVVSRDGRGSYSASKFGLDGLTAALAAEVAKDGVLANCVAPGFIDTDLTREILGEKGMRETAARVPLGRLGRPEEIAHFVAWLCGPENTYISGQRLIIDGGFCRV